MTEAINKIRRRERQEMIHPDFKTKKAYRKWQKKQRRDKKEKEVLHEHRQH